MGTGTANKWREVLARLAATQDLPDHVLPLGNKPDPYDELVYICLTVMTRSQPRIDRAFDGLRALAGDDGWTGLLHADLDELRRVLEPLGFVNRRTEQLLEIVRRIDEDHGGSLEPLRSLDDDAALAYLTSLPGVGTKTAKCVLMYSLGRDVLPVDIHVLRVSKRLGLVEESASWKEAEARLERDVPDGSKFRAHVALVVHGRDVCKSPNPQCHACVLLDACAAGPLSPRLRAEYV